MFFFERQRCINYLNLDFSCASRRVIYNVSKKSQVILAMTIQSKMYTVNLFCLLSQNSCSLTSNVRLIYFQCNQSTNFSNNSYFFEPLQVEIFPIFPQDRYIEDINLPTRPLTNIDKCLHMLSLMQLTLSNLFEIVKIPILIALNLKNFIFQNINYVIQIQKIIIFTHCRDVKSFIVNMCSNYDIKFTAHNACLESHSLGSLKCERLESHII